MLKDIQKALQPLSAPVVQPIVCTLFGVKTPELIEDKAVHGGFKVTLNWTRPLMKSYFNWDYRAYTTTTAGKLFTVWKEQGKIMTFRVVYLVKLYNIPSTLVVNFDQIGIHLVTKGAKHIHVLGIVDKEQITSIIILFYC